MSNAGFRSLVLLAMLAGCSSAPNTLRPEVRLPETFEAPLEVARTGVPLERWWTGYHDPQLERLVDQALTNAPDAKSARARLEEALAVRQGALAAFGPQGELQASTDRTNTTLISGPAAILIPGVGPVTLDNSGVTKSYNADFSVSWEIDLFGRRRAAKGKADAVLAAARFDFAAARASLAANVADQLFLARGLAIELEDAREDARIQRELARIAQKTSVSGVSSTSDAERAASLVAQADAVVLDLAGRVQSARRTALILIGRGADRVDSLPVLAEVATPPAVPAAAPGELLVRRPDVREAAEVMASAAGQLVLDKLARLPRLTLQPELGAGAGPGLGGPAISEFWSIGAGLTQPILDYPRLKTVIRAQGARVDEAVIAYEKVVQIGFGEAENALVELSSDEARVAWLTTGELEAHKVYQGAQANYAAGVADLTSVLQAERTWRSARTALTSAQVQALRRSVQAFKALGGGWSPDLYEPDEPASRNAAGG